MITVYVWLPTMSGNVGHSSIRLGGGGPRPLYISWWPGDGEKLTDILDTAWEFHSLEDDEQAEGRRPDYSITILGLNEARARHWWRTYRHQVSSLRYRLLSFNCSTVVRMILNAAGADNDEELGLRSAADRWNSHQAVWMPLHILAYALIVQREWTRPQDRMPLW